MGTTVRLGPCDTLSLPAATGILDRLLLSLVQLMGFAVIFAAIGKVWWWPDPASLELLPLFSLPLVWTTFALVEIAIGVLVLLADLRRMAIGVVAALISISLVVNGYLYLSNQRVCPCLDDLRFGTLGSAFGETALVLLFLSLSVRNVWGFRVQNTAGVILVGAVIGAALVGIGRSSEVFTTIGKLDSMVTSRGRLQSTALFAGRSAPGETHFTDLEVVAGEESIVVTGCVFPGSRPVDGLPLLVPAHTKKTITLRYDAIQRTGEYLLPGYLFTSHDEPGLIRFFISGSTKDKDGLL